MWHCHGQGEAYSGVSSAAELALSLAASRSAATALSQTAGPWSEPNIISGDKGLSKGDAAWTLFPGQLKRWNKFKQI